MKPQNDIPVLRAAVSRTDGDAPTLTQAELENLRARLSADVRTLVDELLTDVLNEAAANLRLIVNDRLGDELPELIDQALKSRLGDSKTD